MIFNSVIYENSMPQGMGVLEIVDDAKAKRKLFIPLTRTEISGKITGPLASLQLTQVFSYPSSSLNHPIEAVYRFPLPGDALITGAEVSFGDEVLKTSLKERDEAKDEYHSAFEQGRKGILITRETADIFTLHLTGIEPDQPVTVSIRFLQYGIFEESDIIFRVPLTVAPRYIRDDERTLSQRNADPLLMLIDPGHTFSLNLLISGKSDISSPSHPVTIQEEGEGFRVILNDTEVRPDRDFILISRQISNEKSPTLSAQIEEYPDENTAFVLATVTPPKEKPTGITPRELIILVDHSGSMEGAKWQAADWTVKKLLKTLRPEDTFALGVFHTETKWLSGKMSQGNEKEVKSAIRFLEKNQDSGGTELGQALEAGLSLPKEDGNYVRHVIIITDAEVTDEGRLIRMVREEQQEQFPRHVSVICIDAAPNTPLVREMTRIGGGIARFLTSDPDEQDITTALEKTLAFFEEPAMGDLSLVMNRDTIILADREGLTKEIPIPSLSGSSISIAFQVSLTGEPLTLKLTDPEGNAIASAAAVKSEPSGIREIFGSGRIRMLEQIRGGFYKDGDIRKILSNLGYAKKPGKKSLYPEKGSLNTGDLDEILVHESYKYGIPSVLTALVCTSEMKGTPVKATVVVPSAYPSGWNEDVYCDACAPLFLECEELCAPSSGPEVHYSMAPPSCYSDDYNLNKNDALSSKKLRSILMAAPPVRKKVPKAKEIDISLEKISDGILFEGKLPRWTKISGIRVSDCSVISIPADVKIEIYINGGPAPIASISLIDLLDGDIRPLNVRLKKSDRITLSLIDIHHQMTSGTIRLQLTST